MTKRLEADQRQKKEYSPRGERGQRMYNFRMDLPNYEWLQKQQNKGRLLNTIIEEYRQAHAEE